MFRKLNLNDFKCYLNREINFKQFTVLAGANASGKSSVIQALLLLESSKNADCETKLNINSILGVTVGSPLLLRAQNTEKNHDYDFMIGIDGCNVEYIIDKETRLDCYCKKNSTLVIPEMNYINAERIGPRMFYEAGGELRIKKDGSNAVYLLDRADDEKIKIPPVLKLGEDIEKFSYNTECWMRAILGDMKIDVNVDAMKAQAEIKYGNDITEKPVTPALTGFGISYVFPVVVAGLLAASRKNQMLIVENPEAHLHPSAQSAIGKFLYIVSSAGVQVIVETHSEHVVDGARLQALCMKQTDNIIVNYFKHEKKEIDVKELKIQKDGELEEWPEGFFDQKRVDLRQLFKLRMRNDNTK